jgi:hypothetical protein
MTDVRGLAMPITELSDEEIPKLANYSYAEIKQTTTRLLLGLTRYGIHYDIVIETLTLILGELLSMKVQAEKVNRAELEIMVIELLMDRGREMKEALSSNVSMQEAIREQINKAKKEIKAIHVLD